MYTPSGESLHQSIHVKDNLYFYLWKGMGNNCNTCVFTDVLRGDRPHVMVDPGLIMDEMREPCFDSLVSSMKGNGLSIEDVGLIINTHAHPDHCGANQAVIEAGVDKKESSAIAAMSKEEDEYRHAIGQRLYSLLGMQPPEFEPYFYLEEGELVLGKEKKLTLQVLITPGHSPGSACLYWPDEKVLITGDVVFLGSVGRTDFPGGSMRVLMESIERLSHLDVEWMLAGHSTELGGIIDRKEIVERNFQAIKMMF